MKRKENKEVNKMTEKENKCQVFCPADLSQVSNTGHGVSGHGVSGHQGRTLLVIYSRGQHCCHCLAGIDALACTDSMTNEW
jgi:hypothetical protein